GPVMSVTSCPRSCWPSQESSVFSCAPPTIRRVMMWTIFMDMDFSRGTYYARILTNRKRHVNVTTGARTAMNANDVSKLVIQEIDGRISLPNSHGVDLKPCLVTPILIPVINRSVRQGKREDFIE